MMQLAQIQEVPSGAWNFARVKVNKVNFAGLKGYLWLSPNLCWLKFSLADVPQVYLKHLQAVLGYPPVQSAGFSFDSLASVSLEPTAIVKGFMDKVRLSQSKRLTQLGATPIKRYFKIHFRDSYNDPNVLRRG